MTDISGDHTAEWLHCDDFLRENANPEIRRPAHDLKAPPLVRISASKEAEKVVVRRSNVSFTTRRTSFEVWAALTCLENLLSDYRRISPRFGFMQTAGQPTIATGNEYRLTLSDPALLAPIKAAIGKLISKPPEISPIEKRTMDIRVVRTGPWGGETGELVVEALRNHALAGASSLWILAHDEADDGNMRVTLDSCEISRWAWAPDLIGSRGRSGEMTGVRIVDWDYLFERLAQGLEATQEATEPASVYSTTATPKVIAKDDRIIDVLRIHSGLEPYMTRIS